MKKWVFGSGIVALFLTAFLLYRNLVPQKVDYFVLEPRNFLETLVAAGRVKFSEEVEMAFQVPGIIQVLYVKEGERVKSGDLLLSLDDTLERNQVQLARTELNLAEINLRKLIEYQREIAREEYHRAVINRRAALEEYERAQMLFQSGTIPREELNRIRRNWETALSLENAARLNLENISDNGPGFLEMKAQVEKASLELAWAEINLKEKHLYAPVDGVVISLKKNPGEFVQAGEVIVVLGKNPLQVVTSLDEREYKKIRAGMRALVSEQANPKKEVLTASVLSISPTVDPTQGTIKVTLSLDEGSVNMKPDAAVNVEIVIREEKGVTTLPKRYLSFQDDETIVWTEKEGKAYPLSLSNLEYLDGWVKITDLPPGTVVLDPKGLQNGKRIELGKRRND